MTGKEQDADITVPDHFPAVGDVAGRRVVITGASRGLGRVVSAAFAAGGASLCLVARNREKLMEVRDSLPGRHVICAGSVVDADFNDSVADTAVQEFGGLDVWICNAGISPVFGGPLRTSPEQWREVIEVNLTSAFLGARAASRVMGEGARIIMTTSVLGERPRRGLSAYSASKAGIIGLTKALALDLASKAITVNAVAPGWFYSPMAGDYRRPENEGEILGHTALRRWGRGTDISAPYLYLASEASSFVTGTVLAVDGGYLLA
jgi:NAD(P)-dependent dehydrogenase (short-subunit alcohol dehydrogenase family)